jgi:hypothetical protein
MPNSAPEHSQVDQCDTEHGSGGERQSDTECSAGTASLGRRDRWIDNGEHRRIPNLRDACFLMGLGQREEDLLLQLHRTLELLGLKLQ